MFHDWNWVFVPYLDGGYYAGARHEAVSVKDHTVYFRGRYNVDATVYHLAELGLAHATDVVLSGGSSGAIGVIVNADRWHGLFRSVAPNSYVRAAVDSGFYLNVSSVETWTRPVMAMQNSSGSLSARCVSQFSPKSGQDDSWYCLVPEIAANFIESLPIFLWQSRYDYDQITWAGMDVDDVAAINAYGERVLHAISQWAHGFSPKLPAATDIVLTHRRLDTRSRPLRLPSSPALVNNPRARRGAFIDACLRHTELGRAVCPDCPPELRTPLLAFAAWDRESTDWVYAQWADYPCAGCCLWYAYA